jgi:hypothetical protein
MREVRPLSTPRRISTWWLVVPDWLETWWIVVPLLSLGFLASAPFFVIAARTRHRPWARLGLAWFFAAVIEIPFLLAPGGPGDWTGKAAAFFSLAIGFGATAHLAFLRREYLRRLQVRRQLLARS